MRPGHNPKNGGTLNRNPTYPNPTTPQRHTRYRAHEPLPCLACPKSGRLADRARRGPDRPHHHTNPAPHAIVPPKTTRPPMDRSDLNAPFRTSGMSRLSGHDRGRPGAGRPERRPGRCAPGPAKRACPLKHQTNGKTIGGFRPNISNGPFKASVAACSRAMPSPHPVPGASRLASLPAGGDIPGLLPVGCG